MIDALVAPDKPLIPPHIDAGNADRLASTADHPEVLLRVADDGIFGVYQDWVHQNPGKHMDGLNKGGGK